MQVMVGSIDDSICVSKILIHPSYIFMWDSRRIVHWCIELSVWKFKSSLCFVATVGMGLKYMKNIYVYMINKNILCSLHKQGNHAEGTAAPNAMIDVWNWQLNIFFSKNKLECEAICYKPPFLLYYRSYEMIQGTENPQNDLR